MERERHKSRWISTVQYAGGGGLDICDGVDVRKMMRRINVHQSITCNECAFLISF